MLSEENRERKKQQMLETCFELFVKKGLENTSLNDLTAYCRTYKAALYNYFKSKDEIVLETAKMYMKTLDEMFDKDRHKRLEHHAVQKGKFSAIMR